MKSFYQIPLTLSKIYHESFYFGATIVVWKFAKSLKKYLLKEISQKKSLEISQKKYFLKGICQKIFLERNFSWKHRSTKIIKDASSKTISTHCDIIATRQLLLHERGVGRNVRKSKVLLCFSNCVLSRPNQLFWHSLVNISIHELVYGLFHLHSRYSRYVVQILVHLHFDLVCSVLALEATESLSELVTQMAVELINIHLISVVHTANFSPIKSEGDPCVAKHTL